jgi:hypothetical protein
MEFEEIDGNIERKTRLFFSAHFFYGYFFPTVIHLPPHNGIW